MYKKGEGQTQTQDERNLSVLNGWIDRWEWSAFTNYDRLTKEMLRDKKKYSIVSHAQKHKGPALIIGAGISLEKALPYLKDWEGAIFCPESLASTLKYYGREPDYVCVFDANTCIWPRDLKGYDWSKSTLVTHPCVSPEIIDKWKWDKIYYLMMHYSKLYGAIDYSDMNNDRMEAIAKEQLRGYEFFEHILPKQFGFIGASILNAGCVVNNSVEVANFMGYGPLFLTGVDFGFKDWINRIPAARKKRGKWKVDNVEIIKHIENDVEVGDYDLNRDIKISDNGIPTTEEQVEYKIALMSVYKLDRPQLIDCSDGIITELPKADIQEVIKNNGRGFEKRTDSEIVGCADAYFSRLQKANAKRDVNRESA